MAMCRACLATSAIIDFDESLVAKYNLLTNLNINLYDGLPQYFCQSCYQAITFCIEFKEKCTESEIYLKDAIEKTKQEGTFTEHMVEHLNIKLELKTEEDNVDSFSNDTETYMEFITNNENDYFTENEIQEETIDKSLPKTEEKMGKLAESLIQLEQNRESNEALTKTKKQNHTKGSQKPSKLRKDGNKYARRKKSPENDIGKKKPIRKKSISELKSLLCGICRKKFVDMNSLRFHLESHKTNKFCGICPKVAQSWPQLFAHRLQHLPEKQKKCHLCERRCVSPIYLEFHYLNFHNDGQEMILKCHECDRSYATPIKLKKHIWSCHSDLRFICDHCSKTFRTKTALSSHMTCHNTVKTFMCDSCDFACKSRFGLQNHKMYKHTPTKVICQKCLRPFANQEKYDKHKCTLKIIICPVCGVQLGYKNKLKRHMETHKAVGEYKCELCPSVYKTSQGLKTHMNQHKGNRDKKCEYCPARFFYASVLTKHRRIHTGEKPYVCKVCSRSFTGNHNLKVHMRIHGEFIINKKDKISDTSTLDII